MRKFLQATAGKLICMLLLSTPILSRSQTTQPAATGTVLNEKAEPMDGVSISVLDKTRNVGTTQTNRSGQFRINSLPEGGPYTFVISYIGYQQKSMDGYNFKKGEPILIDVKMEPSSGTMSDVVVVGYGTQKKVNLTGAVTQVGSEVMQDRPISNVTQALQGAVPNLNVTFGDGRPGNNGNINIRGYASITGSSGSPLVLIDGVPGSINLVNPRDVESVSVLKDAASSAIYGARGAFGVVLVTTKKAKGGKVNVTYNNNFGFGTPTVSTDFITDGYTSAKLNDDAFLRATGNTYTRYTDEDYEELKKRQTDKTLPSVVIDSRNGKDMYIYYGNTDWWRTMFREWEPSMEHNISFTGGNDKTDYLVSGRYYNKRGVMQVNQDVFNNYNFRVKLNSQLTDWFTLYTNSQFNATDYSYPGWGVNSNFVSVTVHALPSYLPVNPDGTATYRTELNNYTIGDGIYADLLHGKSKGFEKTSQLINTVGARLRLAKGLTLEGNYTLTYNNNAGFVRRTPAPWSIFPGVIDYVGFDQLTETTSTELYHVVNAFATYSKTLKKHNFKLVAGMNQEFSTIKNLSGLRKDLVSEDLNDLNLGAGDQEINGGQTEWALLGYFARLNYDFNGKYLFEVNGRYDGTSRFPDGNRFGFFPSVSAGWRISQENFFNDLKHAVSDLKIRASYGKLGNQVIRDGSGNLINYPYVPTMSRGTLSYIINGQQTEYLTAPSPISPLLTWEEATSKNIGIDISFLRNRLTLSADVYSRATKRMLTKGKTLPAVFGATPPRENAADLVTRGFEFTLGWRDVIAGNRKPLAYDINVLLSDYTSEITRFDNPTRLLSDFYVGQRLGDIWGYTIDGMFATDEEAQAWQKTIPLGNSAVHRQIGSANGEWARLRAGDLRFVDLNGDGQINAGSNTADSSGDRRIIGNSLPRYSFGINMGLTWAGFDLSAFFQGIGKQNWYPGANADKFWGPYSRPYYSFIPVDFESKVWTPEKQDAYFPVLRGYTALNAGGDLQAANNRYLQDLAYVRLKNLTLGYSLPATVMKKIGLTRCRIYVSGENMLTFTKFKTDYIDPEQAAAETNGRVYPFTKTYSFGLDVSL